MIRKANLSDVRGIHALVNAFAARGGMLALSLSDLYDNVRDFIVASDRRGGTVLGCCALHVVWEDLAEIRSLAVVESAQRRGLGRRLVKRCLDEALVLGVRRAFALTYVPEFFARLGFHQVDKAELPHKVWADCVKCPRFPDCDETAVILDLRNRKRPTAG